MAKKFFPELVRTVSASQPHPVGTEYRISIGSEDWDGTFASVIKVQMVYDGIVAGRKSPSYPVNSSDHERVWQVIQDMIKGKGELDERQKNNTR